MVVQIAFVCLLASSIRQLEQCYKGEAQAASYLTENVKFLSQLISCAGVQALYQVSKEPRYQRDYQNRVKAATLQSERLREQAKAYTLEQQDSKEIEELFVALKQASERGEQAAGSQDQIDQAVAFLELRGVLNRVNGVTTKVMVRLNEERQAIAAKKIETQNQIYAIITGTIVANLLLLLFFIFRFDRVTAQRFRNLTENVMSLGANQKLNHKVEGNDDIAEVDAVIHRVSGVLHDARLKEQAIVEQAVDVICALDENGKFQQVNPAAARLWKYENDELLGKNLISILAPEDKEKVHRAISRLVSEQGMTSFETNVVTGDKQTVEMQWNAFFSQEMKQIFCVAHDVTERKNIERLKAKLVEMISHDLRSPMTALQITLNILSSSAMGELPDAAQQRVKRAEVSLAQMVDMLDDFLELEKIDSAVFEVSREEISARDVVELSRNLIVELAGKKKVQIATEADDFSLFGDKPRVVRVLTNLISNAIKFSPENSTIKVTAKKSGDDAVFEVSDEGPGISKEDQATIFERFTQTKIGKRQSKGGIGLGLSVCKAIVDAHGGTIRVESEEGKGCTFIASFPCRMVES